MIRLFAYIFLFLLCFSCQEIDKTEKPKQVIPEETMVKILADLAVYGAAKSQDRRLIESKNVDVVQFIQKKYQIDTTLLRENISYYVADVDRYKNMQEQVRKILQEKKKEVDAINKAEAEEKQRKLKEKTDQKDVDIKELQQLSIEH